MVIGLNGLPIMTKVSYSKCPANHDKSGLIDPANDDKSWLSVLPAYHGDDRQGEHQGSRKGPPVHGNKEQ